MNWEHKIILIQNMLISKNNVLNINKNRYCLLIFNELILIKIQQNKNVSK